MPQATIIFLTEEKSMQEFLNAILPPILGETIQYRIRVFQGKDELLSNVETTLRRYAVGMPESHRIIILVDNDRHDCKQLKMRSEAAAQSAGLVTRRADPSAWQVATCVVIEELEAWYFGDWEAVCAAYPRAPKDIPGKSRYRNPDAIQGGTAEAFEQVLQRVGYYATGLAKVDAARRVGAHFDPARCRSQSFRYFYAILLEACRVAGDATTARGHP
jgi:hypothetical protein